MGFSAAVAGTILAFCLFKPPVAAPTNSTALDGENIVPLNSTDLNLEDAEDMIGNVIQTLDRLPGYAPHDFWNPGYKSTPSGGKGREYELMFCDRLFNHKTKRCDGNCNYIKGTVENGLVSIWVPRTECVIHNCDINPMPCHTAGYHGKYCGLPNTELKASNGMCVRALGGENYIEVQGYRVPGHKL